MERVARRAASGGRGGSLRRSLSIGKCLSKEGVPVWEVHLPDDLRMHLVPAQVVGDFDGRVQGDNPSGPPKAAAGVREARQGRRRHGLLMPTKPPSFSRASATERRPRRGFHKRTRRCGYERAACPWTSRFQSVLSLLRMIWPSLAPRSTSVSVATSSARHALAEVGQAVRTEVDRVQALRPHGERRLHGVVHVGAAVRLDRRQRLEHQLGAGFGVVVQPLALGAEREVRLVREGDELELLQVRQAAHDLGDGGAHPQPLLRRLVCRRRCSPCCRTYRRGRRRACRSG